MHIRSKAEFFRLWNAGALGYKLRTWDTLDAFQQEPSPPPIVGFRQVGQAGGGAFAICESPTQIAATAAAWTLLGRKYMICEAAPDEHGTLQGEVMYGTRGWEGTLGLSRGLRMRDAIAKGLLLPRSPAATRFLLRTYMSPASLDDFDALMDLYPDSVVEFTCYDWDFGRGRNTIFWEVRNY
jgi:hypothetical protein